VTSAITSSELTVFTTPSVSTRIVWAWAAWANSATTLAREKSGSSVLRARMLFTTVASPSSPASTMTERASSTFASFRSAGLVGSPVRHTILVFFVSGTRSRTSASMSAAGRGERMTMAGRATFSLATTSSCTITGSLADQPRMSVWRFSRTVLRPLCSSATRWSMAAAIRPISEPPMKMPNSVTTSATRREGHAVSCSKALASSTRTRLCQKSWTKPPWLAPPSRKYPTTDPTSMMATTTIPSHPMSASGPRARLLSNA
jgi:hypothetical protein